MISGYKIRIYFELKLNFKRILNFQYFILQIWKFHQDGGLFDYIILFILNRQIWFENLKINICKMKGTVFYGSVPYCEISLKKTRREFGCIFWKK